MEPTKNIQNNTNSLKHTIIYTIVAVILVSALFFGAKYALKKNSENQELKYSQEKIETLSLILEGKTDEYQKALEKLLDKKPQDEETSLLLANSYINSFLTTNNEDEKKHYLNSADNLVRKVLEINPNNSEAYRSLGNIYELNSKIQDAIDVYTKSLELDFQNNQSAYKSRGSLYLVLKQYDLAIADLKKALEIYSDDSITLINLATAYFLSNQNQTSNIKIEQIYQRAIEVAKNDQELSRAYLVFGEFLLDDLKPQEALNNFNKALEIGLNKIDTLHYISLANLYFADLAFQSKNTEEFKKYLNLALKNTGELLKINPNFSRAYLILSIIYDGLKDTNNIIKSAKDGLVVLEKDNTIDFESKENIKKDFQNIINQYENKK